MSVRFTLEKRTNNFGECPIRLSWCFGGQRYQTTIGYSIKKTDWDEKSSSVRPEVKNHSGQSADDINFYIKRIAIVAAGIEKHFGGDEKALPKGIKKKAISEAVSLDFARAEDVIERCLEGWESLPKMKTGYYKDQEGRYYKLICDAKNRYNYDRSYVVQQLFGIRDREIVPEHYFRPYRVSGNMYPTTKFQKVSYEEVYGL